MKRLLSRVAILFLTFTVGFTATYLFHKFYIQFECTAMGAIRVNPDGHGRSYAYKSYDGVDLGCGGAIFPSHESAEAAFRNALNDAVRIIEREPIYDSKGCNVVGERVVLILPPNEMVKTERAAVIWLNDRSLGFIHSPSLRHVLAFEKVRDQY